MCSGAPGKTEVGIGHHAEPGIAVADVKPAREMVKMMLDVTLPGPPFARGDSVVALISGLGATPVIELYILFDTVGDKAGIDIHRSQVGNYFTSLEMMGVTLTAMKEPRSTTLSADFWFSSPFAPLWPPPIAKKAEQHKFPR
jgi:dihydroxyacetone kinase-like protein